MKVSRKEDGIRLDIFLKGSLPDFSRKRAKRLLDEGRIRVNDRKIVIASWRLQAGDEVKIADDSRCEMDTSKYYLKVVYEDEFLLVVEKDAGIACEASPLALKPSLVQIVNNYLLRNAPNGTKPYLGLIHRLDTETSGLVVYTKKKMANQISKQFKTHRIERRYQAIVAGRMDRENGSIVAALQKIDQPGGAKMAIAPRGRGQKAETHFQVLERYKEATLLEIIPRTGRTHQIRIHMAHIGHPVWADKLYGFREKKYFRYIKRQALHASLLGFKHPISGKKLNFKSELPKDMRRLLDRLRLRG